MRGGAMLLVLAMLPGTFGATIHVNGLTGDDSWSRLCETWDGATCGPTLTIQAGIDAATDGDTVEVAAGTYLGPGNRNLSCAGKSITVGSADGAGTCIIDCQQEARGFYLAGGEAADTIVQGFTIGNGRAVSPATYYGGGNYCAGASPTIRDCVIAACSAGYGGGLAVGQDSAPHLVSCLLTGNSAAHSGGGAAVFGSCSRTIARGLTTPRHPPADSGSASAAACCRAASSLRTRRRT